MRTTVSKLVTPIIAEELLRSSRGNRQIKNVHLNSMVKVMSAGDWPETIQSNTISLDSQGRLADGHHRLNAIIKSGRSLFLTLEYGLSDHDIKLLDCGKSRSYADYLTLEGWKRTRSMAAVIKMVHDCAYGYEEKLTHDEMDQIKSKIGEQIQQSIAYGGNSFIQTALMIAKEVFMLESEIIDQMKEGYEVHKNSIADIVRKLLLGDSESKWTASKRYTTTMLALDKMYRYKKGLSFVSGKDIKHESEISTLIRQWIESSNN